MYKKWYILNPTLHITKNCSTNNNKIGHLYTSYVLRKKYYKYQQVIPV